MNQVTLMGRLAADPVLNYTQSGKAIVKFPLAVKKNKDEADFFNLEAWEKQAEMIAGSCRKGHRLLISGRLQKDSWTSPEGEKRSAIKVVVHNFSFIEKAEDSGAAASRPDSASSTSYAPVASTDAQFVITDDDSPF